MDKQSVASSPPSPAPRRPRARTITAATVMCAGAVVVALTTQSAWAAGPQAAAVAPAAAPGAPATAALASFPPKSNGAWIYDGAARGQWIPVIESFNAIASPERRINQINTYGSDIEHIDENDPEQGFETYYDTNIKTGNRDTTSAYYNALTLAPALSGAPDGYSYSPIIDAQIGSTYLKGFNTASKAVVEEAADKIAAQICADERVDGIQFDIEPFDVSKDGQYHFYNQISKNFAGLHTGNVATDPFGCVTPAHPQGRYYSVFTFANSVNPANPLSRQRVKDVFETGSIANGYIIDSLYDLGTRPMAHLNDLPTYESLVNVEAANMKTWANSLGIFYAYGIPATASAHEWAQCTGGCVAGADGTKGNPMLEYTKRAVNAINATGAPNDPLYIGANVWSLGSFSAIGDYNFYPSPAPLDVLTWLASNLPGSKVGGPVTPNPTPTATPSATPTPTPTTTPTPTPTPSGLNLVSNGGFENGLTGWSCDGGAVADSTQNSAGSASVKLTPSATVTSVCNQVVTVVPGTTYTLSASLKSAGATVTLGVKNGADVSASGAAFTSKSLTFTATSSSITVYVQAYKQQTGNAWADQVSLVAAP